MNGIKKYGKVFEGSWQRGGISFSSPAPFLKNKKEKEKKNKAPHWGRESFYPLACSQFVKKINENE